MPLTILPSVAVYDHDLDAIRVLALDGQRLVFCAIKRRALARLEPLPPGRDYHRVMALYYRHANRLHGVVARKYDLGQCDGQNGFLIDAEDLPQLHPGDGGATRHDHGACQEHWSGE